MRNGIKVEIMLRDENWRKLDSFKCDSGNFHKVMKILKEKYGLDSKPTGKFISKIDF